MNIKGKRYRTIWTDEGDTKVQIINQQKLPHIFEIIDVTSLEEMRIVIKDMYVRGAGLIGASAGFGMYLAALEAPKDDFDAYMKDAADILNNTRPTAKNLSWALKRQLDAMDKVDSVEDKIAQSLQVAKEIADEDAEFCKNIGEYGLSIIEKIAEKKNGQPVNVLTHCNAGWLAFVDYGSATAPIYAAFDKGINIHVWVDETRPRNQGASLTAWELANHGVPHTLIADNTGGHLMQHGQVDLVITGADRVTRQGDAANKIGTYLKALAAQDNDVPFYVALPSSTFDWEIDDGVKEIEIETRDANEVRYIAGKNGDEVTTVLLCPEETQAINYGFDVTPHRLITGLITERGVSPASKEGISELFGEKYA